MDSDFDKNSQAQIKLLKQLNLNLCEENSFLKSENIQLKKCIEELKKKFQPHLRTDHLSQFRSQEKSALPVLEKKTSLNDLVEDPVENEKNQALADFFEQPKLKGSIFITDKKPLTNNYFIFDEFYLFGLTEKSYYKLSKSRYRITFLLSKSLY